MIRNLLFVDHSTATGGAEQILVLLLSHLPRQSWRPVLACPAGTLAQKAAAAAIPVRVASLPRLRRSLGAPLTLWRGARALARIARESEASLVVSNTMRASLYVAVAARLAGLPFIWYMHDFWLSEVQPAIAWPDRIGKRLLCAAAVQIIVNSKATAAHLPCGDKVNVVHNGLELAGFDPALDGAPFRRQYGIPLEAPVIGMVGRLRPWKGQERFLHLAAALAGRVPEVRFVVVGGSIFDEEDQYPHKLRRMARELAIDDRVIFTGHLADTRPALAAMDIFVHPGDPEPFGLVNIEAMAMARPVVAFAHGALPEIVVDGNTGVLVAPSDEEGLAVAIQWLLSDRQKRSRMGQNGRERVANHFAIGQTVTGVEAVLRRMLNVEHSTRKRIG
jgi:glycosyltransferase involved in cell wall biosynthesis